MVVIKSNKLFLQKSYPFRLGFINDIHAGGQYAVWPPEYKTKGGKGYGITGSEAQVKLWEYFMDFADVCKENKVNILCIAGDLLTGQNQREAGAYTMTVELEEQKKACAYMIAEFVKRVGTIEQIYIFKGTPYHGARDTSVEEGVVTYLKKYHDIDADYRSEYAFFNLEYGDRIKKLFITHPASNAQMYPEQAMGKDMMLWQEQVGAGKIKPVDMIIRAHKHTFIEVHKGSIRALQLPCWQFFVPYDTAMKNYARWQPDIGGVVMLFDEQLRTTVWHFLYENIQDPGRFLTIEAPYKVEKTCLS